MTQSSMHLPPLRHGRRVRHTEAADTGRSPSLRPLHQECGQASHLQWLRLPSLHQRVNLVATTLVTVHLCVRFLGL